MLSLFAKSSIPLKIEVPGKSALIEIIKGYSSWQLTKNFSPTFGVISMEKEDADEDDDIDMVWRIVVEKESMEARGLSEEDLVLETEVLSSGELSDLMAKQEVILTS